jgi:hypothetical protein
VLFGIRDLEVYGLDTCYCPSFEVHVTVVNLPEPVQGMRANGRKISAVHKALNASGTNFGERSVLQLPQRTVQMLISLGDFAAEGSKNSPKPRHPNPLLTIKAHHFFVSIVNIELSFEQRKTFWIWVVLS